PPGAPTAEEGLVTPRALLPVFLERVAHPRRPWRTSAAKRGPLRAALQRRALAGLAGPGGVGVGHATVQVVRRRRVAVAGQRPADLVAVHDNPGDAGVVADRHRAPRDVLLGNRASVRLRADVVSHGES